MKVLLAASLYPPETRGPATFAGQLVEHLQAKKVTVAVVPYREVRGLPPVVRHVVYFFKLLRQGKISVIVALDPISVGLPVLVASLLLGARFVLRIGGDYAWEQGVARYGVADTLDEFAAADKERYPPAVRLLWFLQCFVARRAFAVVVPSEYLKSIVVRWGVAKRRVVVIRSASSALIHSLSRREIRARVGWRDEPVIFSVGALVPWKGFKGLLDAVANIRDAFPGLRLVVVGGGPQKSELESYASERGFDPGAVFFGEMPQTVMRELMSAADVFALNTGYEGLSHALIEAMQVGLPIVTTPAGGNAELFKHGKTALLVPHNDTEALAGALRELLEDRRRAAALGAAARTAAEVYSPERSMAEWEKLLRQRKK